jgi:hypothetical protein
MAAAVHSPAAQRWHRWYEAVSWYLPDGQCSQVMAPIQAAYLPTSHSVHSAGPVGVEGRYWPTAQLPHAAAPAVANLPSGHTAHASAF